LVFLDEVGFSLALYLLYGWGHRKKRLVESVPLSRGKNWSVLGALASEGMVATVGKLGAMKRIDVERFLEFNLLPKLPTGSVLVWDNATIHKGGRIAEIVAKAGCFILYLSPYSPDFSPIELAWGWIKQYVRRSCPRDEQARQEAVERSIANLPNNFTKPWFAKCGYSLN
jgi:transposase